MRLMSEPMVTDSLDAIADQFIRAEFNAPDPTQRRPVTLWLSVEEKTDWDALQKSMRRQFGKGAREVLVAFIRRCKSSRQIAAGAA